ncbi:MAG: hypothetical protein ACYDHT_02395 [Solirubrobacteraceae bacterium]
MSPTMEAVPTPRQLRYLRSLAGRSATTFVTPATRGQASREIDRLRALDVVARPSRLEEPEAETEEFHYATALRAQEVSGYYSAASWRASAPAPPRPAAAARPKVAQPTEIGHYSIGGGERVLYGELLDGRVTVTDRPRSGLGPSYLVERELEGDDHPALIALLADYIRRAREFDEVPMASAVVRQMLSRASGGA